MTLLHGSVDEHLQSGTRLLSGILEQNLVQNVSAYDTRSLKQFTASRPADRLEQRIVRLLPPELGFAYRSSAIKHSIGQPGSPGHRVAGTGRWVVLERRLQL